MHMIAVHQKFQGSVQRIYDTQDYGTAYFECATTARTYARKAEQQGKTVVISIVNMMDNMKTVSTLSIDDQILCDYCLTNHNPCNLVTVKEHNARLTSIFDTVEYVDDIVSSAKSSS